MDWRWEIYKRSKRCIDENEGRKEDRNSGRIRLRKVKDGERNNEYDRVRRKYRIYREGNEEWIEGNEWEKKRIEDCF